MDRIGFDRAATAASPECSRHPPRVPLVLRLGVTGHRPDSTKRAQPDVPALRSVVSALLGAIRRSVDDVADAGSDLYAVSTGPAGSRVDRSLRIVSALAPGPDQWVARAAIALGYQLHCVLPFDRSEYLRDFEGEPGRPPVHAVGDCSRPGDPASAKTEYSRLLDLSAATFELDGRVHRPEHGGRLPDSQSYAAAGRAILRQSDLLVAIWDGQPAHGPAGTGQVVDEALQRGIPVVWIPWGQPSAWQLLRPASGSTPRPDATPGDEPALRRLVGQLLLPPDERDDSTAPDSLRREYFQEDQKRGNPLHGCWEIFVSVVCGELLRPRSWRRFMTLQPFRVDPAWAVARDRASPGPKQLTPEVPVAHRVPDDVRAFVDRAFLPHYAWANGLSLYYGNLHRSALVVNALLAATAVSLALVGLAAAIAGRAQSPWVLAELLVIVGILGLTHAGRRRRWHERWIDYRMLAERIRLARCTSLLGGGTSEAAHAGHLAGYGNPLRTWMHWHYLAIERAAGLTPGVSLTREYLAACRRFWLDNLVEDQRRYHAMTGERLAKLDRRLHRVGNGLFIATLIVCLLHAGHLWVQDSPGFAWVPGWAPGGLTLLCAFLPAAGAAFAAIRSLAEVRRLAQRSRGMEGALWQLHADLSALPIREKALDSERLRLCADRVGELLIREMLDWRVVFQDRPLNLPA